MRAMASLRELADALYLEEVSRARAMDPADKLLEGPRLFERARRLMADGVRHRRPDLDEAQVRRRVNEQLARLAALETS